MIRISVIVPSRNSIEFYRECIESIQAQSEKAIEIILVDAESEDGTWELIGSLAKTDARIHPIRSKKKSYGYQCNLGIEAAKGEYVAVVESDDYIDSHMYERLYRTATREKLDWVKADFDFFVDLKMEGRFFLHYSMLPSAKKESYGRAISLSQAPEMLFRDLNLWNGIYKKEFLKSKKICFQETKGAAFQDLSFVLQTLIGAESFMYLKEPSYRYRRDNQLSSVYNSAGLHYVKDEFRYMSAFLKNNSGQYDDYRAVVLKKLFRDLKGAYGRGPKLMDMEEKDKESLREFQVFFQEYYNSLSISERMEEQLSSDIYMHLFINDIEQFDCFVHREREVLQSVRREIACLAAGNPVVIAGAGEWGSGLYAFLKNNGMDSVQVFCDNNPSMTGTGYMGLPVLSVEEACRQWQNAVFLVATGSFWHEIRRQLLKLGIRKEQIIRSPLIPLHEALEERL